MNIKQRLDRLEKAAANRPRPTLSDGERAARLAGLISDVMAGDESKRAQLVAIARLITSSRGVARAATVDPRVARTRAFFEAWAR